MTEPSPTAPATRLTDPYRTSLRRTPRPHLSRTAAACRRPGRLRNVAAGEDEPALVELHNIAKPVGVRFRTDEYEHGCRGNLLMATRAEILQRGSFEVALAAAVDHTRAQTHIKVRAPRVA